VFLESSISSIRRRVAIVGTILIVLPMLVLGLAGWAVFQRVERVAAAAELPTPSIHVDLAQMAQNLVDLCRKYQQAGVEALKNGQRLLKEKGPIRLNSAHMSIWHAVNELTGEKKSFEIPLMSAGELNLTQVNDFDQPAPVVDEIEKSAGTSATVFQRLNERGDMLRIASSVKSSAGTRAIATFIPADARHGESAKILQSVLDGKTYIGNEVQGNVTFLTAYQPLINSWGKVVGMLNTALPEEQIKTQVTRLVASSAKTTGKAELFILKVSEDPSSQGNRQWSETDGAGQPYVRDIRARATQLTAGQLGEYKFQKASRAGGIPRTITARFAYVPELDWVVGYSRPENDLQASVPAAQLLVWAVWLLFGVGVAATGLAVRVWLEFVEDLAPKLIGLLSQLRKDAKQLTAPSAPLPLPEKQTTWAAELNEAIDQITFATNQLMVTAALEGAESVAASADEIRGLVQRCRIAARKASHEIQPPHSQLPKESVPPPPDENSMSLMKLAAGIDRRLKVAASETSSESSAVGTNSPSTY